MIVRFPKALVCVYLCSSLLSQAQAPAPSASAAPRAAVFQNIQVDPQPDRLIVKVTASAPITAESTRLANPDRLVFDFAGCEFNRANRRIPLNRGPVKEVRLAQFGIQPPVTRIVVELKEPLNFLVSPSGNEVVIEISYSKVEAAAEASGTPAAVVAQETAMPSANLQKPPDPDPPKPPNREIADRALPPSPGAYALMAQARALSVADLEALEDKSAAGDPAAQTMFALAYHAGVLLKKDDAEALRLLRKAADQKFAAAEESLGIFTHTGVGSAPDPAGALAWYKKAAQHGSLDAATDIALIYASGNGVAKDPVQAVSWFRRAAEGGDGSAQYNLALMYDRGEGVPKNPEESLRWLAAAADQGVIPALLDMGRFRLHPSDSEKPDVDQAVRYYTKAADLGSGVAQAILGNIFANGTQGKVDYEQSVKWYRKAAEQGIAEGQFGLGVRYALGQGVPMDLEEAHRLFQAAAAQGLASAQFDLATMYEEGKGSTVNTEQAAHYYQLAADQGFVPAQFRYGKFLAKSTASSDRVAAYKWLMLAQDSIKQSASALSDLRSSMSAQEIAEAEREVDKWRVTHQPNPR